MRSEKFNKDIWSVKISLFNISLGIHVFRFLKYFTNCISSIKSKEYKPILPFTSDTIKGNTTISEIRGEKENKRFDKMQ